MSEIDNVTGFYYDHQMTHPEFIISLHANARPVSNPDGWAWSNTLANQPSAITKAMTDGYLKEKHYDEKWDGFFTNGFTADAKGKQNDGYLEEIAKGGKWGKYYAEPICTSIFTEDFGFAINNDWSTTDNGNAIESLFNSAKPWAPIIGNLADGLKSATDSMKGEGDFGSRVVGTLNDWAQSGAGMAKMVENKLNKALYIQGTRFSTYQGTSTHFSTVGMKFTLLSDWKQIYPGGPFVFMSVFDQFNRIYPYAIGTYQQNQGGLGFKNDWYKGKFKTELDSFIDTYVGWQSPPGGFESYNRNINVQQKGTLRMLFGGYYTLDNLVVKSCNVNFSRQLCKIPDTSEAGIWKGKRVPMYADVTLELMPASVYTDSALGRFLNNSGMTEIQEAMEKNQAAQDDMLKGKNTGEVYGSEKTASS